MHTDGLIKCLEKYVSECHSKSEENKRPMYEGPHLGQPDNTHHRHRENRYQTLTRLQQKSQNVLQGDPGIVPQFAPLH